MQLTGFERNAPTVSSNPSTPSNQISRFRLLRTLGQGAEGVVYLGSDPELGRNVAIKTLNLGANPDLMLAEQLLDAARTVGTLSHPNIVPVFEVGMHEGQPFVVFEFVEGRTLAEIIKADGAMPMARSVVMMSQILAGVAQVHASGVLHGDLNPANILIGANGIPRVTDFGISRRAHKAVSETVSAGTVRYMAPECFVNGRADYRSDVFALGLIFHEMLSGEPLIAGGNVYAQIHRILNEAPSAPSAKNVRIAPAVDAIVLKALSKNPLDRYADAAEMKRDLDRLRVQPDASDQIVLQEQRLHSTVEFLLRRMSIKSDFPALSATLARINQLSQTATDASLSALSELIMRDFALTQKLLRVVNSAAFGTAKIAKVSQAISLLGITQLRSIAAAMILAAGGRTGEKSAEAATVLTDAFISAVISRNIGRMIGLSSAEELFICGMFGRLGQLLTMYYLNEDYVDINRRIDVEHADPMAASRAVLGLSYDQLGTAVARKWNFPDTIVNAMAALPPGELAPPATESERMAYCAAYARELCDAIRIAPWDQRVEALDAHIARFEPAIPVEASKVCALIARSVELALKYVAASGLKQQRTPLLDGLNALSAMADTSAGASRDLPGPAAVESEPSTEVKSAARESPVAAADTPRHEATPQPSLTLRLARAWRSMF